MIQAQRLPDVRPPEIVRDPAILEAYLEDASAQPPGESVGLARVATEAEAASLLRQTTGPVLVQGGRSSLTGGAIPHGELILSVEQMTERGPIVRSAGGASVTVQPGMRLDDLQRDLASRDLYYPPTPTYQAAMIGGTVSTNAGGAASFKYGVTRQWIQGLRVLLFNGDLLVLERGRHVTARGGEFRIALTDGRELMVPTPTHPLPALKKISAGYHSAETLDLVDLFIGAEGTLGMITAVTVQLVPRPAAEIVGLLQLDDARGALALAAALRAAALESRVDGDPCGPDIRSIEWMDEHCLRLVDERGAASRLGLPIRSSAQAALLFELELPDALSDDTAQQQLADFLERRPGTADTALTRTLRILQDHMAVEALELAFPEDEAARRRLLGLREAVPVTVNELLIERRRRDPAVAKVGGDLIVPQGELASMIEFYRRGFASRGLEFAIWGHLSDGNLHPNAMVHGAAQLRAANEVQIEFAAEAARRGGCPLSEHGVGRSPLKQEVLRRFLGERALTDMRRVKDALDPPGRFAPGVLFAS